MRTVCFVTNEIYPAHSGGIGRLVYNFCKHNSTEKQPASIHVLLTSNDAAALALASSALDGIATVHSFQPLDERADQLSQLFTAKRHGFDFSRKYADSFQTYLQLVQLQAKLGHALDIVEFADFGGGAAVAIAAKKAGIAFQNTALSVRLHSSFGLITWHEKYYHHPSSYMGYTLDLERYALRYADIVVGHVGAIAKLNAEHYQFGAEWLDRVVIEFPLIEPPMPGGSSRSVTPVAPDFLFSSRLQPFKRPDLFVKAGVEFLERQPTYPGMFRLVCSGWDSDYVAWVKSHIPSDFTDKFFFVDRLDPLERDALIRESIVIVPSEFESLCLFAFECAAAGAKVILNSRCLAFSHFERWKPEDNCLLFDGTAHDLSRVLERALVWQPKSVPSLRTDTPYWCSIALPAPNTMADEPLSLAVVHIGAESLEDIARFSLEVADFLPSDQRSAARIAANRDLSKLIGDAVNGDSLMMMPLSGATLVPEELSVKIEALETDIVVLWPKGYRPHRVFLKRALAAFSANSELGVYSSLVRCVHPSQSTAYDLFVFGGELPSVALQENVVAPRFVAFRRELLRTHPFDDRARSLWLEVWLRKLVVDGVEILIAPSAEIDFVTDNPTPANSIRISGTLYDDLGVGEGLTPRLLSLEAKDAGNNGWPDIAHVVRDKQFLQAQQRRPRFAVRDYPLVQYRGDLGGLLVHPVVNETTVAEVPIVDGAIRFVNVQFHLAHHMSEGVEVAIGMTPRRLDDSAIQALVDESSLPIEMSAWTRIGGGHVANVEIAHAHPHSTANIASIFCRVPEGCKEDYGHLVIQQITVRTS